MHPDRLIVRTYRHSYGLYMIPYGQNTLTRQSDDKNDAPRYPLHGPVTNSKLKLQSSERIYFPIKNDCPTRPPSDPTKIPSSLEL